MAAAAAAGPSFLVGWSRFTMMMILALLGTRIVTCVIGIIVVARTCCAVSRSRVATTTAAAVNRTTRSTTTTIIAVYMSPVESSGSWIFDRPV